MLPDDSYLRRLPGALDPIERLRFESIVFSSDVVSNAYQALCELAGQFDVSHPFSTRQRAALFSHAWTIVDQLHVLRQFVLAISNKNPGPNQQKFLDLSANARLMRNRMDHLSGLMKNLSKEKGRQIPLFGAITYFLVGPNDVRAVGGERIVTGGTCVTVTAGSVPDGKLLLALNAPHPNQQVRIPVGQFRLEAFDWTLDIDATLASLRTTLNGTATKISESLTDQLKAESARTGTDLSVLAAPLPMSNLGIAVRIHFRDSES
jgi:hypothetical protein